MGWGVYLAQDALSKNHVEASYVEISTDLDLDFAGTRPQLHFGVEIKGAGIFC